MKDQVSEIDTLNLLDDVEVIAIAAVDVNECLAQVFDVDRIVAAEQVELEGVTREERVQIDPVGKIRGPNVNIE